MTVKEEVRFKLNITKEEDEILCKCENVLVDMINTLHDYACDYVYTPELSEDYCEYSIEKLKEMVDFLAGLRDAEEIRR